MKEDVKYFTLLGDSQLDEISRNINLNMQELYNGWFGENHHFKFSIIKKNESLDLDLKQWNVYANTQSLWLAFKADTNVATNLLNEMLGLVSRPLAKMTAFTSDIYNNFIDSNVSAIYSLANTVYLKNKGVLNLETNKGSGAIIGQFGNGKAFLKVAIGGDIVKSLYTTKSLQSNMSMSELVAREVLAVKPTVTLNVIAGSTEMSLKQLTDLDVGDVVLLNTKLDSGFYVTNKNGVNLAKVHLGKQANQKVIQLIE
jgi:hypothetical protein